MRNNFRDEKWLGKKFGHLTVLSLTQSERIGTHWLCQCDCGNRVVIKAANAYSGHSTSCGCAFAKRKHGLSLDEHGKPNRLYSVWVSMRSRCNNPNCGSYANYGGRGISVCEEWDQYPKFYEWAIRNGYDADAPKGQCTLDRIDVNGNYSPENCRWADPVTQALNKRPRRTKICGSDISEENLKKMIDIAQMKLDGKTYDEIAKKYGVSRQAIHQCLSGRLNKVQSLR